MEHWNITNTKVEFLNKSNKCRMICRPAEIRNANQQKLQMKKFRNIKNNDFFQSNKSVFEI